MLTPYLAGEARLFLGCKVKVTLYFREDTLVKVPIKLVEKLLG